MSMIKAERVVFSSPADLVDYASKGLPPTRQNWDKFIARVRNPMTDEEVINATINDVAIPRRLFENGIPPEVMADVLDEVYKNNVRTRNIVLGTAIGLLLCALFDRCRD